MAHSISPSRSVESTGGYFERIMKELPHPFITIPNCRHESLILLSPLSLGAHECLCVYICQLAELIERSSVGSCSAR